MFLEILYDIERFLLFWLLQVDQLFWLIFGLSYFNKVLFHSSNWHMFVLSCIYWLPASCESKLPSTTLKWYWETMFLLWMFSWRLNPMSIRLLSELYFAFHFNLSATAGCNRLASLQCYVSCGDHVVVFQYIVWETVYSVYIPPFIKFKLAIMKLWSVLG